MAQAYGSIVTSKSADCIVDAYEMANALNGFNLWTTEGGAWTCFESEGKQLIIYDAGSYCGVMDPTITLFRDSHLFVVTEDDEEKRIAVEDASDEDFDNAYDFDEEEVPLSEFSKVLSRHIQQGWFEVACCSQEKTRYAAFGRLRIHSDGTVERLLFKSSHFFGSTTSKMTFDPQTCETHTEEI